MEPRKTKKADLESKRTIFMQVGLAVALLFTIVAFEWKSYDKSDYDLGELKLENIEEEIIPITKPEQTPPPPPPPPVQQIEIVEDEKEIEEEAKIEETEITQETKIVPIEDRKSVV